MYLTGPPVKLHRATPQFAGILRTLGPDTRAEMKRRFAATVAQIAQKYGATADCGLRESYPGVVTDAAMTRLAQRAAADLLGAARVLEIAQPTMTTEDFGYFLQARPGTFYHIGAGCALPLHNPGFLPDEGAVVTAAATHAAVLTAFLTEVSA